MSANKLSRRACTAALCAAFATILGGTASAQSLSYMPIDRDSAVLHQPMPQTENPNAVPGGDELPAPLSQASKGAVMSLVAKRLEELGVKLPHPASPIAIMSTSCAPEACCFLDGPPCPRGLRRCGARGRRGPEVEGTLEVS